jgi:outer membrane protein assembly factor BamB
MNMTLAMTGSGLCLLLNAMLPIAAGAQHEADPSGAVELPLKLAWVSREMQPPTPAFRDSVARREGKTTSPADRRKLAIYHRQGLAEPATYDYAPQPVVAYGRVYAASSTDEALFCLDAATGKRLWAFRAAGAVRFAPVVAGTNVFFCCDDGAVYGVDAATGAQRWRRQVAPRAGFSLHDGRLMSAWPVRGGLTLAGDKLYCGAGVFPEQGEFLAALDPESGAPDWVRQVPNTIHGGLFVDGDTLWTPTHRTTPCLFARADGTPQLKDLPTLLGRGAAQIWRLDRWVAWGPDEGEIIYVQLSADTTSPGAKMKRRGNSPLGVVSPLHGWCAVAGATRFVLVQDDRLIAVELAKFRQAIADRLAAVNSGAEPAAEVASYDKLMGSIAAPDKHLCDRLENSAAWIANVSADASFRAAVLAGESLIVGGLKSVRAYDLRSGAEHWSAELDSQVWKLAVAEGALFAGTESGAVYCFRHEAGPPQQWAATASPAGTATFAQAAALAVAQAGRDKGICLVAGGGTGQLAAALAERSQFHVVILEPDAARAAVQRSYLEAIGLYGRRVVVRHEPGQALADYPLGMANLIVSEEAWATGQIPYRPAALLPLLQPYGGTIVIGLRAGSPLVAEWRGAELGPWQPIAGAPGDWRRARRGALPSGGQWPTANGSPGNSMCSGQRDVPAAGAALRLQWLGAPYPGEVLERHAVPMAPLFNSGIVAMLGRADTAIGLDAYNGTILWRVTMPGIQRVLASHNSSPITFSEDGRWVFTATGPECWQLDAVTGQKKAALTTTQAGAGWGYLGPCGGLLIGTSQGPMDFSTTGGRQVNALQDWSASAPAVSQDLFAVDIATGQKRWTFAEGLILNPTLAIGGGRIYLAQSRNAAARANRAGNMKMGDWMAKDAAGGAEIVALDAATGKVVWRRPVTRELDAESHWIMYLTATDDALLATHTLFKREGGSSRRGYDFELLDAATGQSRWTRWLPSKSTGRHAGLGYGKNSLSARPIIIGDRFYLRASLDENGTKGLVYGFELSTGKPVVESLETGSQDAGCSVAVGSATALYFRDYRHTALDLANGNRFDLTGATRPSCWPNTLPVGGLVLSPEGSAGCSCGLSYQASFALAPAVDSPAAPPRPRKKK